MSTVWTIKQKLVEIDPETELPNPFVLDLTVIDDARTSLMALQAYLIQWRSLMVSRMSTIKDQQYPDFQPDAQNPCLVTAVVVSTSFDTYIQSISDFLNGTITQLESSAQSNTY